MAGQTACRPDGVRGMSFIEAIGSAFRNYVNFGGRARRSEYWWFALFLTVLGVVALVIDTLVLGFSIEDNFAPINSVTSLATFLPSIAVSVRRLHDIGRSGWWLLIAFTIVGFIPLIYWACQPGDVEANAYGPPVTV